MKVRKFSVSHAELIRSPGQNGDVFAGNVGDQKDGGPITMGFDRHEPDQSVDVTFEVDDVMIVLESRLTVTSREGALPAGRDRSSTCRKAGP